MARSRESQNKLEKSTKGQWDNILFWAFFTLILIAIGIYFMYTYFQPTGNSFLRKIFGAG